MPHPEVRTFFDAIAHLDVYARGTGPAKVETSKRQAVLDAYDIVTTERHWRHFATKYRIFFDEPYSTGTIAYNHTTRTVTLTGGTFPTWAAHGHIKVGNVIAKVDQRTGDTTLILDDNENFQQAVTASTTYTLFRVTYPLPDDLRGIYEVLPEANWIRPCSASFLQMARNERYWQRSSNPPLGYDVEPDPTRLNGWQIRLFGYPSEGKTFDNLYQRHARPLVYDGSETAAKGGTNAATATTVSCAQSTTVTASASTFEDDMAGSMLMFGQDGTYWPESRGDAKRYTEQARIKAVGGGASLTLYEATTKTHSAVNFRVSCPIDLPVPLIPAFYRCCEWQLEISRSGDTAKAEAAYRRELFRAFGIEGVKLEVRPGDRGGPFWEVIDPSYLHGDVRAGVFAT